MDKKFLLATIAVFLLVPLVCFAQQILDVNSLPKTVQQVYNGSGGTLGRGDVVIIDVAQFAANVVGVTTTTSSSSGLGFGVMLDTVENTFTGRCITHGYAEALFSAYGTGETTFGTGGTAGRGVSGNTGMGVILESTAAGTLTPVYVTPAK